MHSDYTIDQFIKFYGTRPMRRNTGGLQEASFFLWQFLLENDIQHVIESGVWRGQTTWLIAQTRPDVTIDCLDPITCCFAPDAKPTDAHVLEKCGMPREMAADVASDFPLWWVTPMEPPQIQKAPHDILTFEPRRGGPRTLVILDDHQDLLPRFERCLRLGIEHIFIDDDHPWCGDHKTMWSYRNFTMTNGRVTADEATRFQEFFNQHVAECEIYPHIEYEYFKQFEPHQHFKRIRLK